MLVKTCKNRLARIGFAVAALSLAGCHTPGVDKAELWIWPKPPDLPRFAYETTLYSPWSITEPRKKSALERFATARDTPQQTGNVFVKPYDISAYQGRIYVTDTGLAMVHVFDVPRRRYFQMGFRFEGKLTKPAGVTQDRRGFVYVSDIDAARVVKYDSYGLFQQAFGNKGDLHFPTDVAVTPEGDRLFVVERGSIDSSRHGIVVFNAQGDTIQFIGKRGKEPGEFNLPVAIELGLDGNLYVLDAGNFRVQVLSKDGAYLRSFGQAGITPGSFSRPRSMALTAQGHVLVGDAAFGNVQVFDAEGHLLMALGGGGQLRNAPGHFPLLAGITVDETDRVYVVDQFFRKVEVVRRLTEQEGRVYLGSGKR